MPEFLGAEEVARMFGLKKGALYTQRRRGHAPGVLGILVGNRLLWRVSDLDEWWEREQFQQNAQVGYQRGGPLL